MMAETKTQPWVKIFKRAWHIYEGDKHIALMNCNDDAEQVADLIVIAVNAFRAPSPQPEKISELAQLRYHIDTEREMKYLKLPSGKEVFTAATECEIELWKALEAALLRNRLGEEGPVAYMCPVEQALPAERPSPPAEHDWTYETESEW